MPTGEALHSQTPDNPPLIAALADFVLRFEEKNQGERQEIRDMVGRNPSMHMHPTVRYKEGVTTGRREAIDGLVALLALQSIDVNEEFQRLLEQGNH